MTLATGERIDEICFCFGFKGTNLKPKIDVFSTLESGPGYALKLSKNIIESGIALDSLRLLIMATLKLLNLLTNTFNDSTQTKQKAEIHYVKSEKTDEQ